MCQYNYNLKHIIFSDCAKLFIINWISCPQILLFTIKGIKYSICVNKVNEEFAIN